MVTPRHFVIDVDGVMTDGRMYYTAQGKDMKAFGPDDHDALLLLKPHIAICFVTGDRKGFAITKKRIADDMKFRLEMASTLARVQWMEENGFKPAESIYMGDGILDAMVFDKVAYSIAPANAFPFARDRADFVTQSTGGNSAVAEACVHILEKFFEPVNPLHLKLEKGSGEWGGEATTKNLHG